MTPTLVAGGFTESEDLDVAAQGEHMIRLQYGRLAPTSGSYQVDVSPRLRGVLRRSEQGWIALAPELGALGHGDTWEEALEQLRDAVEQYLEFLRDDRPTLASAIAHHAMFVGLLDTPPDLWFGSVSVNAAALE
ncbi:MAG TPA: type II toxin-antitoxin system HicB family antitoxin [Solirubrobacteraceae bacterium]|jgi:predicted RNase H-like HicB family nuclease|nr:type II toxin-antitoxin system HicB family antitoxin [Solirubrobacteraceae bacterium]